MSAFQQVQTRPLVKRHSRSLHTLHKEILIIVVYNICFPQPLILCQSPNRYQIPVHAYRFDPTYLLCLLAGFCFSSSYFSVTPLFISAVLDNPGYPLV